MNRNQIEASLALFDMPGESAATQQRSGTPLQTESAPADSNNSNNSTTVRGQLINLDGIPSPAVLAGILGVNVAMVYQYRQDGKLPPNSDASYRDCIRHHVTWLKNKATSKASNMGEASLIQTMELNRARTEQAWLAIKKERGELIDLQTLAETFESAFLHLRSQLVSLARKHPEQQREIDNMLSGWEDLGRRTLAKASDEYDSFIQMQMEKEVDYANTGAREADTLLDSDDFEFPS